MEKSNKKPSKIKMINTATLKSLFAARQFLGKGGNVFCLADIDSVGCQRRKRAEMILLIPQREEGRRMGEKVAKRKNK